VLRAEPGARWRTGAHGSVTVGLVALPILIAAGHGQPPPLLGLKENIIIGHLIPAGTGQYRYQEVEIEGMEMPVLEELPGTSEPLPGIFSQSFAEAGFSLGGDD